ncbi:MAG: hypothetical protein PHI48_06020 [Bacteroidales bacterium]|nr:hypothetical protein [Bacteroidales bacterium]
MKKILYKSLFGWSFVLLICITVLPVSAQEENSIINYLTQENKGEGTIRIYQNDRIAALVGKKGEGKDLNEDGTSTYLRAKGYRVHLYSEIASKESMNKAKNIERKFLEAYPEIGSYVTVSGPKIRVRVGDFKTWEEANLLKQELRKKYRDISAEAMIVKDDIRLDVEPNEQQNNGRTEEGEDSGTK